MYFKIKKKNLFLHLLIYRSTYLSIYIWKRGVTCMPRHMFGDREGILRGQVLSFPHMGPGYPTQVVRAWWHMP